VRVLNSTCSNQKLTKESPWHNEPVMLVTPPYVKQPQVWDTTLKLKDTIAAAMPCLSGSESTELEELIKFWDVFAMKSVDCEWTISEPPHTYRRAPTNWPTSEEASNKRGGWLTKCSRTHNIGISECQTDPGIHLSSPEQGLLLLRGLQETEHHRDNGPEEQLLDLHPDD
jgi:hypothetical protein